jgi:ElaB/YqjD/DUF883 family membrane-anchored ribosome-binding protein
MTTEYGRTQGGAGQGYGGRINEYAERAESKAQGMAEQARQGVSQAASAVQSTVSEARGYVQGAVEQARDKMTEYREEGWGRLQDDVVQYTRSQPLAALGMAAAIGLLLGWLSSAARR